MAEKFEELYFFAAQAPLYGGNIAGERIGRFVKAGRKFLGDEFQHGFEAVILGEKVGAGFRRVG